MRRRTSRNVKHGRTATVPTCAAAGMLEAECQFRRIIGYADLATAMERELDTPNVSTPTAEEADALVTT